jgi:hypothetical protein
MHRRIEEINTELDSGVSGETARALGTELRVYEMIDSLNNLVSMTEEDWANILGDIELSDLNPGYLMEAWATNTVEEVAPAFLSENPQERELARGALWMDAGLLSIGALSGAGPTTTRMTRLIPDAPDFKDVRVLGTTSKPNTNFVGSTVRPLENKFIDDLVAKPSGKLESIYRAEPYAEEIIVPVMRPGTDDIRYMPLDARTIANERGAPVVSFGTMERFPEASQVTFFGQANQYVLGRRSPDDLHNGLVAAGLSPETIELAGCSTLARVGYIESIGAWALGWKPLAPRLHSRSGATILGYPRSIYTDDIIGEVDQVKFPP